MNHIFLLRLGLDFLAACLLLVALAYYWLDNAAHELAGTGMFLLIIVHNAFNRRWYGKAFGRRRDARGLFDTAATMALLVAMLALLVTSVAISRTVFSFLPLNGGFTPRQIHTLAAYWVLVFVSIHLGLRWPMIMGAMRNTFGIATKSAIRATMFRVIAASIAIHGGYSALEIGIGSKLAARITMDFWDFNEATALFFLHHVSIVGLCVFLTHYTMKWIQNRKRRNLPDRIQPDAPPSSRHAPPLTGERADAEA